MGYNFSKIMYKNKVEFLLEGQRYYNYYHELIESATESIHLQTYIFEMDSFGTRIYESLIKAAQRGVKVYLLIDSVGSKKFSRDLENTMKAVGIHFARFNSMNLSWLWQWGRRLHHKILIIDHTIAVVGGINVTTSGYGHDNITQQLDFAMALQGPVVIELVHYCQEVFRKVYRKKVPYGPLNPYRPFEIKADDNYVDVKISINDWVYRRWQITQQYAAITRTAQKEITIINSYFFPRRKFMIRLVAAARRGVRVRLILPQLSDWPSWILASQFLYGFFLKNGIEIYEWKKSILHGKMATVDSKFTTMGSFNLNYTGYQQNLEMNVDIYSEEFTRNMNGVIEEMIKVGCEKLDAEAFIKQSTFKVRCLRLFFYVVLSMVANFSVSLTYQEADSLHRQNKYYSLLRIIMAVVFLLLGIMGTLLPLVPGFPFLIVSFLLVYKQLLFNRRINI